MPLRRIFSDEPLREGAAARLTGEAANHVAKVLRLRVGETLVVFDGSGRDFEAEITGFRRDEVSVLVGVGRAIAAESPAGITLLQGVCRGPRMDTVIQKATELGVRRIQPVLCERSVVRLDAGQAERKRQHWRRVAIGACEQCGRSVLPGVAAPRVLETALSALDPAHCRLLLDPAAAATLASIGPARQPVTLLVGPEGGLTEAESRLASDCGFQGVRLGPRILRTDTAPLAALAILQFLSGDLG
jgi:16S rRNA (uracil1498-N3)-methyltransferase